jgi:predicted phosphodiesterase
MSIHNQPGRLRLWPLWPREVCDLLMARNDLTIRGNHDRWVSGPDPARMGSSDRYAFSQLNQDHRSWLASLPALANAEHGIFACHGTPTNDNQYLVEGTLEGRLARAGLATIRNRLGDVQARVVLCGHSHQQHLIQVPDGPLILNPAGVGCPSYDDPSYDPHVSEAGSPHARYAVIDIDQNHVSADLIVILRLESCSGREERPARLGLLLANRMVHRGYEVSVRGSRLASLSVG